MFWNLRSTECYWLTDAGSMIHLCLFSAAIARASLGYAVWTLFQASDVRLAPQDTQDRQFRGWGSILPRTISRWVAARHTAISGVRGWFDITSAFQIQFKTKLLNILIIFHSIKLQVFWAAQQSVALLNRWLHHFVPDFNSHNNRLMWGEGETGESLS